MPVHSSGIDPVEPTRTRPRQTQTQRSESESETDRVEVKPAGISAQGLQDAWLRVTGNIEHSLYETARLIEDFAARQVPPANPDEIAEPLIQAFVDYVASCTRKPPLSGYKFVQHFTHIQEQYSGRKRSHASPSQPSGKLQPAEQAIAKYSDGDSDPIPFEELNALQRKLANA